jgi:hypothetical protein
VARGRIPRPSRRRTHRGHPAPGFQRRRGAGAHSRASRATRSTTNDVRQLAPEQIRQGRFGEVVFVDLPTAADRADIFRVHLGKRGRDPAGFDLEELAASSEGFSGAEIEAAVKGALLDAFRDGARAVTTADVAARARAIRPTSEVKREEIEELRRWAREHLAVDAVRGEPPAGERRLEFWWPGSERAGGRAPSSTPSRAATRRCASSRWGTRSPASPTACC